ncbi:MAG: transposase, partial [Bacillus sp. (in: firmicutes)]
MKHVVAFDVSMGKSVMTVYDGYKRCEYECEIKHSRSSFQALHERLVQLTILDGEAPEIVFEATGVYSKGLEMFLREHGYKYCRINPLEANL